MYSSMSRKVPVESISDSSSASSSEDESAPIRPKSRRDRAQLAFQKSPTTRLLSLFKSNTDQDEMPAVPPNLQQQQSDAAQSTNDKKTRNRSSSVDSTTYSKSAEWDALDEDLVSPQFTDEAPAVIAKRNITPAIVEVEEKETFDRWRGRLWPGKAVVSYTRVLTRCQPPITIVGEKLFLGKSFFRSPYRDREMRGVSQTQFRRDGNNLWPHWSVSDLPTIGTYFDSVQAHSSAFFLLIAEESRAALSSQYDEAELEQDYSKSTKSNDNDHGISSTSQSNQDQQSRRDYSSSSHSRSKNRNGWLEGEIAMIVEETPMGHLPDACHDPRLGSVWVVSVLIKTSNVLVEETVVSGGSTYSNKLHDHAGYKEDKVTMSGGDVIVIHSGQWDKPILGIIQPWDPDYDIKFGPNASKVGNFASNNKYGQDFIMINIMICVDGGDPSETKSKSPNRQESYDPYRSGWASSGSVFPGTQISVAVLGNVMTYIRECQALLSLRMLSSRLQNAILRAPQFVSAASTAQSSLGRLLESSKDGHLFSHQSQMHDFISKKLWSALAQSHNPSQLHALQAIIARDEQNPNMLASPIHLLQGPPGTGKTKTILGIISVFFAGGLPVFGKSGKGQRVVAGASIISNNTKSTNVRTSQQATHNQESGNQQNVNILNSSAERDPRRPRILICAPSNTAVDELIYRIVTQGIFDEEGVQRNDCVTVVRIGSPNRDEYAKKYQNRLYARQQNGQQSQSSAANKGTELSLQEQTMIKVVEGVCLDNLVEEKRQQLFNIMSTSSSHVQQQQHPSSFVKTGHVFTMSSQQARTGGQTTNPSSSLNASQFPNGFRVADLRRHVLERADIVCCTLSGAGSQPILEILLRMPHYHFDAVIIDEAAQTVEPSSLIPLKFNPQVVVMVGDPCQLPPTIFSSAAKRANYGQSLFERLQLTNQIPLSILATQYRMHPAIAAYPAQRFYNGHLFHGLNPSVSSTKKVYHDHLSGRFQPLVFHDIAYGVQEYDYQQSVMNQAEALYVVALYDKLISQYNTECRNGNIRIGIIVPYRGQRRLLLRLFKEKYGRNYTTNPNQSHVDTEISTVDGFQGREKDIIIFSCVRGPMGRQTNHSTGGTIGFLRDWRRLNVAITRAKNALWIVGNGSWLSDKDAEWNSLIMFIQQRSIQGGMNGGTQYLRIPYQKISRNFQIPLAEYLKIHPVRVFKPYRGVDDVPTNVENNEILSSSPIRSINSSTVVPPSNSSVGGKVAAVAAVSSLQSMSAPSALDMPSSSSAVAQSTTYEISRVDNIALSYANPPLEESKNVHSIISNNHELKLDERKRKRSMSASQHTRLDIEPEKSDDSCMQISLPEKAQIVGEDDDNNVDNEAGKEVDAEEFIATKRAKFDLHDSNMLAGPFKLSSEDRSTVFHPTQPLFSSVVDTRSSDNHTEVDVKTEVVPASSSIVVHQHHRSGNSHNYSFNVTQVADSAELSSPVHTSASGLIMSSSASAPSTTATTFVVSSPTRVHTVATPGERLRTFYNYQSQVHRETSDEPYWFASPSVETTGPFSSFQIEEVGEAQTEEPTQSRKRALSSISLTSTSTQASK